MTGLEALKIVEKDCEDLEQVPYGEFAIIEKSLKALEIIKKKRVNMLALTHSMRFENLEYYNDGCFDWDELTQKEYDLLKEVLK